MISFQWWCFVTEGKKKKKKHFRINKSLFSSGRKGTTGSHMAKINAAGFNVLFPGWSSSGGMKCCLLEGSASIHSYGCMSKCPWARCSTQICPGGLWEDGKDWAYGGEALERKRSWWTGQHLAWQPLLSVCECAVNLSFEFILMLYNYEQLLLSLWNAVRDDTVDQQLTKNPKWIYFEFACCYCRFRNSSWYEVWDIGTLLHCLRDDSASGVVTDRYVSPNICFRHQAITQGWKWWADDVNHLLPAPSPPQSWWGAETMNQILNLFFLSDLQTDAALRIDSLNSLRTVPPAWQQ